MGGAGEHHRRPRTPLDPGEGEAGEREKHPDKLAQELADDPVSRLKDAHEAIERSRAILAASRDRVERNEAVLRRAGANAGRDQPEARRVAASSQAPVPSELTVTMTLMATAAQIERQIAKTLRSMAGHEEDKIAARRRRLAEDAIEGARQADKRHQHLQQLARQWAEHADEVTLHRLLAHAAHVLTDLARTEQDIADTFNSLAGQDGPALAAQRRRLAATAAANARAARARARDMRRLAKTSAVGEGPGDEPERD